MPLPTLDKSTYQFTVNQTLVASGTQTTDAQKLWIAIVNALLGFGSNPWTVVGSSNGIGSFSMAGTNYWAAFGNLIWATAGTNHSWIVLKQSQIGASGGLQVCIDLNSNQAWNISIVTSAVAGFTGGSATARPTATDENVLFNVVNWGQTSSQSYAYHVWQSTDGQVVNFCVFYAGTLQTSFHASVPKNPISGWTKPSVVWAQASSVYQTGGLYSTATSKGTISGPVTFYLTGEAVNNTLIESTQNYADDNTGEWPFGPVGLFSPTSLNRGRKGQLFDLWWGTTIAANGDNYPSDGSKQFVQFGHLIFPWNGSTPLTA